ncbi:MAG: translation initiation factor IF-2 subunit alpha [Candidatus Aramenus sp.]|nr:translation initiation factor IF-2 subunit alpha [Candidatus Aramenus sp.]
MIYNRHPLPREGDVLIATVKQIFDYGAYVTLDEYGGLQAFLPWSEISTRWVKNIRDVIKEDRKVVVKVIRIDRRKGTVDVSLKKVNDDEKRKKNLEWKKLQKIDKILEIVSKKLGKTEKEAWEQVAWKLEDKYGDVFEALQRSSREGEKVLLDAGVPEVWVKPLMEEATKHVEEKKYKESQVVVAKTNDPYGVEKIRKLFSEAVPKEDGVSVKIYSIGAPRYRIDVVGTDPKELSRLLEEVIDNLKEKSKEIGIEFSVAKA